MTKAEFLIEVAEILNVENHDLNENSQLESLGWDSLSNLGFMSFADSKFNIVVSPKELMKADTVSDLLSLVASQIAD